MSEPKKETVRIVLPPRREGQPLASTPRETAMINLPPKPVPAAPAEAAPAPVSPPPAASSPSAPPKPAPPAGFQPPSAPGIPKPPSFPGAPKPPGIPPSAPSVPLSAPGVPKPASPPSAPGVPKPAAVPPSVSKAPPVAGPAPVAVKPEAKKETAKVASGIAVKPQATVRLQPRPQPSMAASATFKAAKSTEIVPVTQVTEEEEIPMNLSIAALATAVIALLVQVWFMI